METLATGRQGRITHVGRRFFAALMAAIMAFALLPTAAFAAGTTHEVSDESALRDAIQAADNGDTIKFTASFEIGSVTAQYNGVAIGNQQLTFDLNGQTVTGITNAAEGVGTVFRIYGDSSSTPASLTVIDSSSGGCITTGLAQVFHVQSNGSLIIEDGTFSNTALGTGVYNDGGTVRVSGGSVSGNIAIENVGGTLTVNGGTISGGSSAIINSGTLTVWSGTVSGSIGITNEGVGTVDVIGGSVNGTNGPAIHNTGTGKLTVGSAGSDAPNPTIARTGSSTENPGTIHLAQVPTDGDKNVLTVKKGTVRDPISETEQYAVYFAASDVTGGNVHEYYSHVGGSVGNVYPTPSVAELWRDGARESGHVTLQAAIDEAEAGDTVKLQGDIDLGSTGVTIAQTLTLDLMGNAVTFSGQIGTAAVTLNGSAALTVTDSGANADGGGSITATNYAGMAIRSNSSGALTVAGGLIESVNVAAINNTGSGAVNITGGTVKTAAGNAIFNNSTGKITVSGTALVTSACDSTTGTIFLNAVPSSDPKTVLEVTGGTVSNTAAKEGYSVYFGSSAGVTTTTAPDYLSLTGGSVGRIYPAPVLTLRDNAAYDIPAGVVNTSYTSATALFAFGGTAPYRFTVEPSVAGLSINADNTLTYSRPSTVQNGFDATVKVTDSTNATATVSVFIGGVTLPQLPAPTGLAWGTGERAGIASWNAVEGANRYQMSLFKDLGIAYAPIRIQDLASPNTYFNLRNYIMERGPGAYYFTVQASGDSDVNNNSETVESARFTYSLTDVAFSGISANGSDTASTSELYLTFDADVAGLAAGDFTVTGASRGALSRTGEGAYTLTVSDVTVTDNANVTVSVSKFGYTFTPASMTVAVRKFTPHAHSMSCDCATDTGEQLTFTEFSSALDDNTLTAGSYYLANDVTLTDTLKISGVVNLCLNGHKLTAAANRRVIQLDAGVTLNLCDCCQGDAGVSNAVTCAGSGASGTVNSGVITGGDSRNQTDTTKHGGGVLIEGAGATFNIYGGAVSGNTGEGTGGVRVMGGASVTLYGGEISYNCAALASAGGVIIGTNGSFTMHGGVITNNSALAGHGGGVFINGGTFTMTGGTITGNSVDAESYGGGVYLGTGAFNISGSPSVSGNTREGGANNVELASGKTVSITGALTDGASLGITANVPPTTGNPVAITGANGSSAYASYFTSDSASLEIYDDGAASALTVKLRVPLTKLPTPANLAWGTGDNLRRATWSAVENASGYAVQVYKGGTASANAVGGELTATGTSLSLLSTLAANGLGTYYFTVRATGDDLIYGDGDASSAVAAGYAYFGPTLGNNGLHVYGNGIPLYITEANAGDVPTTYVSINGYYGAADADLVASWSSSHSYDNHVIYGGCESGNLTANTEIHMNGGSAYDVYGGNKGENTGSHTLTGNTTVDISGGTVRMYVYGGGDMMMAAVNGSTNVTISGTADVGFVSGGGGAISGDTNVTVTGGTVEYTLFGGGWDGYDTVAGDSNVIISGGVIYTGTDDGVCVLGGGFNSSATVYGNSSVTISGGTIGVNLTDYSAIVTGGGGYATTGSATVTVTGGTLNASIVGGNAVNGNASVILSGGTVNGTVSASNNITNVTGARTISVSGTATVQGAIYISSTSNYRVDIAGALSGGRAQVFKLSGAQSVNAGTTVARAAVFDNADATKFTLTDGAGKTYPLKQEWNGAGGGDVRIAHGVTITIQKDGAAWSDHGQTVELYRGTTLETTLIGDGNELTGIVSAANTYTIWLNGASTGETVTVTATGGSRTLDFYTVTFNANGGNPTPIQRVALENTYLTAPTDPTRGEDTFEGWYSDSTLETAWVFATSAVTGHHHAVRQVDGGARAELQRQLRLRQRRTALHLGGDYGRRAHHLRLHGQLLRRG